MPCLFPAGDRSGTPAALPCVPVIPIALDRRDLDVSSGAFGVNATDGLPLNGPRNNSREGRREVTELA